MPARNIVQELGGSIPAAGPHPQMMMRIEDRLFRRKDFFPRLCQPVIPHHKMRIGLCHDQDPGLQLFSCRGAA